MNNYQPGFACPVQWVPYDLGKISGRLVTLDVESHSVDISVILSEIMHTGLGGDTGRLANRRDASGTVNADFDADLPPYLDPPRLREGQSGYILFYYSALSLKRPIQVPMIIEKLHYEMQQGSHTKYSFDVKMNALIGTIIYPTN